MVGLVAFLLVLALVRDLRPLAEHKYWLGLAGSLLLLRHRGLRPGDKRRPAVARRRPVHFQPAEFGKVLLMVFFAAYLVDVREVLTVSTRRVLGVPFPPFRYLAPLLTVWGFSILLMIFMKDLGTSLLFFGALLALIYVATGRFFYVVMGMVLFLVGATALYSSSPTCRPGWTSGSIRGRTRAGKGYQIVQSLFSLAAGGLFGRGLGQGYLILQSGNTIIPHLGPTSSSRP